MSPVVPSAGVFSVKYTGRPRMLTGGVSVPPPVAGPPPPIHTADPPVPTDRAIVASCGNVWMDAIHTAFLSEEGSIRAYMPTMFSYTIVWVGWPACAATCTDAG